jgi:hypothetical protein
MGARSKTTLRSLEPPLSFPENRNKISLAVLKIYILGGRTERRTDRAFTLGGFRYFVNGLKILKFLKSYQSFHVEQFARIEIV